MSVERWRLRGYAVGRPVRRGRRGQARLARESGSGQRVLLRRLPVAGEAARERLLADVVAVAGLGLEHVVRLRRAFLDGDVPVLVYDDAPGGSLAELLERRAGLTAGELVTVLVPLSRTLDALHAAGWVHGDVTTETVVFSADGRPLLDGAGLVATDDASEPLTPGDDVRALAEVASAAIGADAPPALVDAVRRALAPVARPSAHELAAAVRAAAAPVPVDLRPAAAPVTHAARLAARRRVIARRAAAALVAMVGVVAAAVAGQAWASRTVQAGQRLPGGPSPAVTSPPASPAPDWRAAVAALDERRRTALATLDEAGLASVYVPGSAPLHRDVETLRTLRSHRLRVVGGRLALRRVDLVAHAGGRATLRVVDVLAAYDVLDTGGRIVRHDLGRGPKAFRLVLVRVGDGWRISEETAEALR